MLVIRNMTLYINGSIVILTRFGTVYTHSVYHISLTFLYKTKNKTKHYNLKIWKKFLLFMYIRIKGDYLKMISTIVSLWSYVSEITKKNWQDESIKLSPNLSSKIELKIRHESKFIISSSWVL